MLDSPPRLGVPSTAPTMMRRSTSSPIGGALREGKVRLPRRCLDYEDALSMRRKISIGAKTLISPTLESFLSIDAVKLFRESAVSSLKKEMLGTKGDPEAEERRSIAFPTFHRPTKDRYHTGPIQFGVYTDSPRPRVETESFVPPDLHHPKSSPAKLETSNVHWNRNATKNDDMSRISEDVAKMPGRLSKDSGSGENSSPPSSSYCTAGEAATKASTRIFDRLNLIESISSFDRQHQFQILESVPLRSASSLRSNALRTKTWTIRHTGDSTWHNVSLACASHFVRTTTKARGDVPFMHCRRIRSPINPGDEITVGVTFRVPAGDRVDVFGHSAIFRLTTSSSSSSSSSSLPAKDLCSLRDGTKEATPIVSGRGDAPSGSVECYFGPPLALEFFVQGERLPSFSMWGMDPKCIVLQAHFALAAAIRGRRRGVDLAYLRQLPHYVDRKNERSRYVVTAEASEQTTPENQDRTIRALRNIVSLPSTVLDREENVKRWRDERKAGKDYRPYAMLRWLALSLGRSLCHLPEHCRIAAMNTPNQYLMMPANPDSERSFQSLKQTHGSVWLFAGCDPSFWFTALRSQSEVDSSAFSGSSPTIFLSTSAKDMLLLSRRESKCAVVGRKDSTAEDMSLDMHVVALCEAIDDGSVSITSQKSRGDIWTASRESRIVLRMLFAFARSDYEGRIPEACSTGKRFISQLLGALSYSG
eukprot:g4933.t1